MISPEKIKSLAAEYGFIERRKEASSTLFFKDDDDADDTGDYPTLINVFYTTHGVMTKISHPTMGYNELWRADAYGSVEELGAIFSNPRIHTGKGYRTKEGACSGCSSCGLLKTRDEFSKNQWKKGGSDGTRKCKTCIADRIEGTNNTPPGAAAFKISDVGIQCDAECGKTVSDPVHQCKRCLMAYYCSEKCLVGHRHTHTIEMPCVDVNDIRRKFQQGPGEQSKTMVAGRAMAAQLAGRRDFQAQLLISEYQQNEGNWEHAIEIYKNIYDDLPNEDPVSQRKVIMGLCRCLYELGNYKGSIGAGEMALEMNRHFPGVHKHIALSQNALGKTDTARKTMMSAILYEAPWDDKNKAENEALLRKLSVRF